MLPSLNHCGAVRAATVEQVPRTDHGRRRDHQAVERNPVMVQLLRE